jgi:hypoxanthine phosphoribosyltransferase
VTQQISPSELLLQSDLIYGEAEVSSAIRRMAEEIERELAESKPLVLCIMSGAAVFAGQLLPRLQFPLEFDYLHVSRYHNRTQGDQIVWKVPPGENVRGRSVLILDDILDEGLTLAEVREKCLQAGAVQVLIAVLTFKNTGRTKPLQADFVGLQVPDRYVFGCGMDVHGWWRNLPAIYALKES